MGLQSDIPAGNLRNFYSWEPSSGYTFSRLCMERGLEAERREGENDGEKEGRRAEGIGNSVIRFAHAVAVLNWGNSASAD